MVECKDLFDDCANIADPDGNYGGCNGNLKNAQDGRPIHIGRDWCPATCDLCGSPDGGEFDDNVIQGKVPNSKKKKRGG